MQLQMNLFNDCVGSYFMPVHLVLVEFLTSFLLFSLIRNLFSEFAMNLAAYIALGLIGIYFTFLLGRGASATGIATEALRRKESGLRRGYYARVHRSCRVLHPNVGMFFALKKCTLLTLLMTCIDFTVNLMLLY